MMKNHKVASIPTFRSSINQAFITAWFSPKKRKRKNNQRDSATTCYVAFYTGVNVNVLRGIIQTNIQFTESRGIHKAITAKASLEEREKIVPNIIIHNCRSKIDQQRSTENTIMQEMNIHTERVTAITKTRPQAKRCSIWSKKAQ